MNSHVDDTSLLPADRLAGQRAYRRQQQVRPIDLRLDANEGLGPDASLLEAVRDEFRATARSYPDAASFEAMLARREGVEPECVLATAGADDALDRLCRVMLQPGRSALLTRPTFEMLPRFIRSAGGTCREIPWMEGPFPARAMAEAATPDTSMLFVVSPNNPTGNVANIDDLRLLRAAAPRALLVLDHAYLEFADEDLTRAAMEMPGVAVTRTLSKAWGLAGMRAGYLVAEAQVVRWARQAGLPYAVSGLSLALAQRHLVEGEDRTRRHVARVRDEVREIGRLLASLGARPMASQANFVLARFTDAPLVADLLAGAGIAVRSFPDHAELADCLRIGCPGDPQAMDRLACALRAAMKPRGLLFDLDGVLADVSGSYRQAIIETAASFGVRVTREAIAEAKAAGNANNDWALTQRLLAGSGVQAGLEEVTRRFETLYQGDGRSRGLRDTERLLVERGQLQRWASERPLAIVTGRPRVDAERFLDRFGIRECFRVLVCMEDAPLKPDPSPVQLAMERLGIEHAWMIGDTVDDVLAARGAGVIPFGVAAPGEDIARATDTLTRAGAARVLSATSRLSELLP